MTSSDKLGLQRRDVAVALTKGLAGLAPGVGPLLGEAIGTVIPNQRIDRVADFARNLGRKIDLLSLEVERLRCFLESGVGLEVFEALVLQVARSTSARRREYLASLFVNAVWSADFDHEKTMVLLRLMDELTDAELVFLQLFAIEDDEERWEFAHRFEAVVGGIDRTSGAPRDRERYAVQEGQLQNLRRAGVISGGAAIGVTELGKMLLREIHDPASTAE